MRGDVGQCRLHLAGAREPLSGVIAEGPIDDAHERLWQIGPDVAQVMDLPAAMCGAEFVHRRRGDGILSSDEVVEEDAKRVDVAARRDRPAGEHFGREVDGRADEIDSCVVGVEPVPGAEVHQHEPAARFAHHVGGLDVAMNQSGAVDRTDRAAQLLSDHRRFGRTERALRRQHLLQRAPLQQLHPQSHALVVHVRAVDEDDVRMADAGKALRLAEEARRRARPRDRRLEQLQRHVAIQPRVVRAIDRAEGALADFFADDQMAPALRVLRLSSAIRKDSRSLPDRRESGARRRLQRPVGDHGRDAARRHPALQPRSPASRCGLPSATDSMSASSAARSALMAQLLDESRQRARHRDARRVRRRLAERDGDLFVALLQLDARHDRLAVGVTQPRERFVVALNALTADGLLER